MIKHRLYLLLITFCTAFSVSAQQDEKAKIVLDQVVDTYQQGQGLQITFKGTQKGTLWVKGDRFVLECGGVKSWFNGTTQWSYVEDNEEVNISSPTPEEIRAINPYALVTMYRSGFNYRYNGQKVRAGREGQEIILLPEQSQDIRQIILVIDSAHLPFYIGVDMRNGHYEEFIATSFEKKELDDPFFEFDESQYPHAEVIDLR